MIKDYRRRFVLSNLLLVGVALLLTLLVLGVFLVRNSYAETRDTMRMVVSPWETVGDTLRKDGERPPERSESEPPEKPEGAPAPREERQTADHKNIITAFYYPDTDEISILSGDGDSQESVLSAVREAAAQGESFGTLPGGAWIYYKEAGPNDCKIALTDSAYLRDKLVGVCLLLLAVYFGAMALVLLVSVWLSKLAAKPMEDAMQMERQFIADVSHDLKTPITVVLANSSILKSNPEAPAHERAQWVESTENAAKKMMTMVEQMLTLSALEAKGQKLEKAPVSLSSAAERAALELDSLAKSRLSSPTERNAMQHIFSATENRPDSYVRAAFFDLEYHLYCRFGFLLCRYRPSDIFRCSRRGRWRRFRARPWG